jgi:hypothetical protein
MSKTSRLCSFPPNRQEHQVYLVEQNDIQQRFVNHNAPVVLKKAKISKRVHEKADARAGGSDRATTLIYHCYNLVRLISCDLTARRLRPKPSYYAPVDGPVLIRKGANEVHREF